MDKYVFSEEIFKQKFLQGAELRNRAKSICKNTESVCPVGSDNTTQFSKVSEVEVLIDMLHGILGEKIDSKKLKQAEESLPDEIEKQVKIKNDALKDVFREIVNDLYIEKSKNTEITNISLLRYRDAGKQRGLGKFFADAILYDSTRELIKTAVGTINNPMDDIVDKAYQELKIIQFEQQEREYTCLFKTEMRSLLDVANQDIEESIKVNGGSITELVFLITFYMFIYLSQIVLKLDKDLYVGEPGHEEQKYLLFKMAKEPVSEDRDCIVKGWRRVEKKTKNIFAHLILLNMLNSHDNTLPFMCYSELYSYYNDHIDERNAMDDAIDFLIKEYTISHHYSSDDEECIDFDKIEKPCGEKGTIEYYKNKIRYLFKCIEYQVLGNTNRAKVRKNVSSNYEHLMKMRFVKSWGSLGNMLMISNDDLLLITQICQRSSRKMNPELGIQITDLFTEFEKRGLCFDGQSRKNLIDHLHQINLIDSKCDSEEAQYVKRI